LLVAVGRSFYYKANIMKKLYTAALLVLLAITAFAQNAVVRGTVKDEKGKPIIGANLLIKGLNIGAATNSRGEFEIKSLKKGSYTLVATYTGKQRVAKAIAVDGDESFISINMIEAYSNLDEIVVTGTGTHHKLKNVPVQTEVITRKDIEKIGVKSFEDLATSMSASFDFTPGTMGSFMRLNGLGNDFIVLMVNGKRVYGDVGGQSDLNRISPDNIEKIEVVKGASSALYGSDAIAGVVNIITKKSKNSFNLENVSRFSKYGDYQQSNTVDVNIGKLTSNTQLARKQMDGYQLSAFEVDTKTGNLKPTDAKAVNRFFDNTISQRIGYAITSNIDIYAQGTIYEKDYFRPYTVADYGFYYKDISGSVGAKYKMSGKSTITFDAASDAFWYYYHYNKDVLDTKTKQVKFTNDQKTLNTKQTRQDYNLKSVTAIGENHLLTVGADLVNEYISSPERFKEGSADAYTLGFYAQDEYTPIKGLNLVVGGRLVDHKAFGSRFTPKVAALYTIGAFGLRASYGQGFKAPTLKELYFEYNKTGVLYLGNQELKPQSSNFYSTSVEYSANGVSASITAYRNDLKNLIDYGSDLTPTPEQAAQGIKRVKVHENISKARSQGVDLLVNAYLGGGFSIGGGYSLTDAKNRTTNTSLEGAAKHYATANASYKQTYGWYSIAASVNGRIQDEKYYAKGNAKGYNTWRLTTTHSFAASQHFKIELTAGIDNIFDYIDNSPYGGYYGTLTPGRTAFGGVTLKVTY